MPTAVTSIVAWVRQRMIESTASFWTDQELTDIAALGIKDLWRAINDDYQDHFLTIDATNVSLAANAVTLTGVPADIHRVDGIEPRNLSTNANVIFEYRKYMHPDFVRARASDAVDPSNVVLYWDITGAGGPAATPTIHVAPKVSSALLLRLAYVPTLGTITNNPIPGESDAAVIAWTVAYARSKERDDRSPDPEWLAVYEKEKALLLVSLAPRQTADLEFAEAVFEPYWE